MQQTCIAFSRCVDSRATKSFPYRSFLAKRGVKEDIISFDARRINPEIRTSVEELLENNARSFEKKNAQRASAAALPLAEWVKANVKYSQVLEKIEPLEKEQSKLQR